jgi:hypothetical protein
MTPLHPETIQSLLDKGITPGEIEEYELLLIDRLEQFQPEPRQLSQDTGRDERLRELADKLFDGCPTEYR